MPDDNPVSFNVAFILCNLGCSLFVEQSDEIILNLTFGTNYHPTISLKLKSGQKIYATSQVVPPVGVLLAHLILVFRFMQAERRVVQKY